MIPRLPTWAWWLLGGAVALYFLKVYTRTPGLLITPGTITAYAKPGEAVNYPTGNLF